MIIRDDYYPLKDDCLKLAEKVEIIQDAGSCSESTAALIVLAEQFRDMAYQLNRLACTVAEWEAEWEEQK